MSGQGEDTRVAGCSGTGSGGGSQDDGLSGEVLELADQVALAPVGVDPGLVVVRAEIVEAALGIREQVPENGQDRVAYSDQCSLLAAAAGQAAVAVSEEGVGAGQAGDDFPEGGLKI